MDRIEVEPGVSLAVCRRRGTQRPFVLVHGLASNARLWDGVADHLASAGHEVLTVDLRGHGESDAPPSGYDTETAASDVATVIEGAGYTGERTPVVAGQSWGGNVVLTLAADHGGVAAIALVDGGWLRLGARFATFDECWAQLAPPDLNGTRMATLRERVTAAHPDWPPAGIEGSLACFAEQPDGTVRARLDRAHHRSILESLWRADPRQAYPRVGIPALLIATSSPERLDEAIEGLRDARVVCLDGADHDVHAQHPDRVAAELLELAAVPQDAS